jgi:hypothetical protein
MMRAVSAKAKSEPNNARAGRHRPAGRRAGVASLLVALLLGHVALAFLPDDIAAARVGGLSALWWFGGVLAPLAAAVAAVLLAPARPAPRSPARRAAQR